MTGQPHADLRLIAFALLFSLVAVGWRSHAIRSRKAVCLDLTRLQLHQDDPSSPQLISLMAIKSVRSIPKSVRSHIPEMSNPGGPFNAGCLVLFFDTPRRRLIFGGVSDQYVLLHYE